MKPLYTQEEFNSAKTIKLLPLECKQCKEVFLKTKYTILSDFLNPKRPQTGDFCSAECLQYYKKTAQRITTSCTNCGKENISRTLSQFQKSVNHFCSKSCSSVYNNTHKKHGTNRSMLEKWLELQLLYIYPNLTFIFNDRQIIAPLELDIYIPELNLAIELNGPIHYEPIFGIDKLNYIKNKDLSKSKSCIDKQVDLCIIDTSQHRYITPKTSQKYIDMVTKIINDRLSVSLTGHDPAHP